VATGKQQRYCAWPEENSNGIAGWRDDCNQSTPANMTVSVTRLNEECRKIALKGNNSNVPQQMLNVNVAL
jgi:hypothetical protein